MRYYEDGTVLYFEDNSSTLKEIWTTYSPSSDVEKGSSFNENGNNITFTLIHEEKGQTDFQGTINGDTLNLSFYNHKIDQKFEDAFVFQELEKESVITAIPGPKRNRDGRRQAPRLECWSITCAA